MNAITESKLLQTLGAESIELSESLQDLWSGYGKINRYKCQGGRFDSIILKEIDPNSGAGHPRGWNTGLSHQRKLRSYEVELYWYQHYAAQTHPGCLIPEPIYQEQANQEMLLALEDLDAVGFSKRISNPGLEEIKLVLSWLATFHSVFIGAEPVGLWERGTYWHLETRPDEWQAMEEGPLKNAAKDLDAQLASAKHRTIVHGDAKLANFCYTEDSGSAAAVDFQYVGGGIGIQDVIYFLSSCPDADLIFQHEEELLNHYFMVLNSYGDFQAAEEEWRQLYLTAWLDFIRFLAGWMPEHWKVDGYGERIMKRWESKS